MSDDFDWHELVSNISPRASIYFAKEWDYIRIATDAIFGHSDKTVHVPDDMTIERFFEVRIAKTLLGKYGKVPSPW